MDLINLLFYWSENNRYVFSRTKFLTILTFFVTLIPLLDTPPVSFGLFFAFLCAILVFVMGFIIHKLADIDSSFYMGGLGNDIKHFMLYWYEGKKFRLSKTKLVSVAIIVIGFLSGIESYFSGEDGAFFWGTVFVFVLIAVVAFAIGFILHKLLSKSDSSDETPSYINKTEDASNEIKAIEAPNNVSSHYSDYLIKVNNLKNEFDDRELKTKELINAKFSQPQITYDKFMAVVGNCHEIFNEQYVSTVNLINFANEDSERIENEINSKMANLNSIIDKMDDLSSELVINMSKSNDDDLHNVLGDMENLISSINDYED
ncbi:MAG: hypothetical protein IJ104_10770 [Methanobrevibacter sp.]|nr:hypothetical protein [Methanobrevibacter sp.]